MKGIKFGLPFYESFYKSNPRLKMSFKTGLLLCCSLILNLYSETANAQSCGVSYFKPQLEARSRVINGITAQPHSWPWTVWLVYRFPNGMSATCGGSLIGLAQTPGQSDIVVTAAHCVTDSYSYFTVHTHTGPYGFDLTGTLVVPWTREASPYT